MSGHSSDLPLEERLDNNDIPRRVVSSAKFDRDDVMEIIVEEGHTKYEALEIIDGALFNYYYNLEEGFPDEKGTVTFSIESSEKEDEARPVDNWDEVAGNKKAKRLAESELDNTVEDIIDDIFVDNDDQLIRNAKAEYDSVDETVEDTNWSSVQTEIERNLRKRLINDEEAHERVRGIIDKFTDYDYSKTELWRFTDEVINEIAEEWSEKLVSRILQAMESTDMRQERKKAEGAVENTLRESVIDGVVSGVTEQLTVEGVRKLAIVITTVAMGVGL